MAAEFPQGKEGQQEQNSKKAHTFPSSNIVSTVLIGSQTRSFGSNLAIFILATLLSHSLLSRVSADRRMPVRAAFCYGGAAETF
jgi:hypothetical protein